MFYKLRIKKSLCKLSPTRVCARKVSGLWRNGPLARVAQSMVSTNQCYLPWKRIGFDTSQPMVSANQCYLPWKRIGFDTSQPMVSANQCYLPWKRIGFDTSQPMVSANHSNNRPLDFSGASKNSVGLTVDLKLCLRHFSFPSA